MKVLVIEDDRRIGDYIKKGLSLKSIVVDLAYDGQTGQDLALSEKYDVIILDRLLPGIDGLSLCQNLRLQKIQTPILMLTAKTQVAERVEGLSSGADDYLGKPFAFAELLARIFALARRPQSITSPVITLGTLTLDPQSMTVTRAGETIKLSKKEFSLLEFLARHENQTVTKDQLIEQVWPYDSEVLPNTAQVYLGYLRTKIDHAFPHLAPLIHTHRGFGYTLKRDVAL